MESAPQEGVLTFRIEPERNLVVLSVSARPRMSDFLSSLQKILCDSRFRQGMNFFYDRRGIAEAPSTDDIGKFASFLETNARPFGKCRWAVAAEAGAAFGMYRMASAILHRTRVDLGVFARVEEALAWLGASSWKRVSRGA